MDYRSFGFCELLRGHSEEDGGLQCSIITPALRSGFQFNCILINYFVFGTRDTPGMLMITMEQGEDSERMTRPGGYAVRHLKLNDRVTGEMDNDLVWRR
jgi:hypothetical protein